MLWWKTGVTQANAPQAWPGYIFPPWFFGTSQESSVHTSYCEVWGFSTQTSNLERNFTQVITRFLNAYEVRKAKISGRIRSIEMPFFLPLSPVFFFKRHSWNLPSSRIKLKSPLPQMHIKQLYHCSGLFQCIIEDSIIHFGKHWLSTEGWAYASWKNNLTGKKLESLKV